MSNDARAKRLASRAHYGNTKGSQDAVLLRLDTGDSEVRGDARRRVGSSRSAFVKLHLLRASEAISSREREIVAAMRARGLSLAPPLARAPYWELSRPECLDAPRSCAGEFHDLLRASPEERA